MKIFLITLKFQHVNALCEALREVTDLISALPADVIALSISMTNGTNNLDMHKYANEMD